MCVLISLAGNYNSEFCPCHLSLEEFVNYIYLVTDTRKMFFEGLAFYGALYLLVNKSTYSVSHKAVICLNILSCKQQCSECKHFFFLLTMVFFEFCLVTLLYLQSSKGVFRDWSKPKIY